MPLKGGGAFSEGGGIFLVGWPGMRGKGLREKREKLRKRDSGEKKLRK